MNLKQLQFAVFVAETRSFSKAAELSFATQPTLSNAISQLEEELGGKLFTRTTRKVDMTPFGEYILPRIAEVLQSRDELMKAAQLFHNPTHKLLRIGFSPLVDMQRLNQVLAPFRQMHPEVSIFFKECFVDELSERLRREQIDIQIVLSRHLTEEESSCSFYQDGLYYLPASGGGQLSDRLSYTLADLPNAPIILTGGGCGLNDALQGMFGEQGVRFEPYAGQALTYKVIEDWASLGIGAGILPKSKISQVNKTIQPLFIRKDEPARFHFEWIWRTDQSTPEHIQDFLGYIQSTVPELVKGQVKETTG